MTFQTATQPADVYQIDLRGMRVARWTRSEVGGLDPSTFVDAQLVRYPAGGGAGTMPALLYKPRGATGKLPVVVIWHGGPEGQSRPTFSSFVQLLASEQAYRRDLRRAEYGDERDPAVRAVQERISPLLSVDKIEAELFVQQGYNDPRVPRTEAEQIVKAVRGRGKDVWYVLGLNEGHGFAKKENRDYAIAIALFLQQKLLEPIKTN